MFSDQQNINNNWMQVIIILLLLIYLLENLYLFLRQAYFQTVLVFIYSYYISSYIFCFNIFTKTTFKLFLRQLSLVSDSIYILVIIL